jgi:hypothetical protein
MTPSTTETATICQVMSETACCQVSCPVIWVMR